MKLMILLVTYATYALAQPYVPTVIWDRSGLTDSAAYGYKILPLGDQNDDGYADWAVQAQGNGGGWHGIQVAYLEFFHGGPNIPSEPYMTYRASSGQMWQAYPTGDVNDDSYEDWIAQGRIFYGGPQADTIPDMDFPRNTIWPMGDFNNDGFSDIATYDFQDDILRIYYGGNPMDTLPDWVLHQPPPGMNQTIPYAVGDFTGDGASDFMCFNPNPPFSLAVFLGGANPDTVPAYVWSNMSWPTTGVDSMNGDGAFEFVRGTPVHFGRPELSPVPDVTLNTNVTIYSTDGKDFNGDTYHDLAMWNWSTLSNPFGALTLHLGGAWINPDPAFRIEGNTPPLLLRGIYTAAGLGDVNGDGLGDIAVGVFHDTFYWRGRCVILAGDDSLVASENGGRAELPQEFDITVFPNPFNSTSTVELILPWSSQLNEIEIYNVLGRLVRRDALPPFVREFTYQFRADELPSGVYFLQVHSGALYKTKKMILLR